ncbi:MAG: hypothetical protein WC284_05865 [Candidimonas sp.]
MSWRFLIALLLLAAGLSAWGGLRLGDWLVAHSPEAPVIEEPPELRDVPVLDADGLPFVAQPPQPLVSGRLGVPEPPDEPVNWEIAENALEEVKKNPTIAIATTQISMEQARQISAGTDGLMGIGDVGGLLNSGSISSDGTATQPIQPIDITVPPPPPAPPPVAGDQDWQAALAREIQACSNEGFFSRPSCAWAARNKYCGPNNAWGRADNCPARNQ